MAGQNNITPSLQTAITELTEAVSLLRQDLAIHNAKQEPFEEMVRNHEATLYGDKKGGSGGLVSDMATTKRTMANLDRAIWIVITPILTGIGLGIIYLIVTVTK